MSRNYAERLQGQRAKYTLSLPDGPGVPFALPERMEVGAGLLVALLVPDRQAAVRVLNGDRVPATLLAFVGLVLGTLLRVVVFPIGQPRAQLFFALPSVVGVITVPGEQKLQGMGKLP